MCAPRRDPWPFWPFPQIRALLPATSITLCELAHVVHFDHSHALHKTTNSYRFGPFVRLRLSRNHRTIYSFVLSRRKTTLMMLFLSDWALRDHFFTKTPPTLSLVGRDKPTYCLGDFEFFSGALAPIVRISRHMTPTSFSPKDGFTYIKRRNIHALTRMTFSILDIIA